MKSAFYTLLAKATDILGLWFFALVSRGIAAGYYLFCPGRVGVGMRFYRALFPERGRAYHLWCTWRQFQNFTDVFMDRLLLARPDGIRYTFEGWEHLEKLQAQNRGAVIVMSHLGNWEMAAHLLNRHAPGLRLLLYMGIGEKEQIEGMQKELLANSGVRIVGVDAQSQSPFDVLEGIRMLQSGGMVSLAGDRIWGDRQRTVAVRFLGRRVRLPQGPHVFALLTGAPLLIFFASRTGRGRYHFTFCEPIFLPRPEPGKRDRAIAASAQAYADRLAAALKENPFEWFHFEPFLGPPVDSKNHSAQGVPGPGGEAP